MTTTNRDLPSLVTANATAGLALAGEMAERLHAQLQPAGGHIARPGGTNYLLPSSVSTEAVASILFYAIAAANHGWTGKT